MKKKKRWDPEEISLLKELVGKTTIEEIAAELGRSKDSVKMFIHFNRIPIAEKKGKNLLIEILTKKFVHPDNFKTTREFFASVKIRQRRFWQLYRGEKTLTEKETIALIRYFDLNPVEVFQCRQLNLFDDNE